MNEENIKARLELIKTKAYLDMYDVMILTGYSPSTIRRRIAEGKLKALQNVPKGKLLFKKEMIENWLDESRVK